MTNAEKYLKNENYKKTLWYDFKNWCNNTKINCPYGIAFEEFMDSSVKPILTEDERVILRNLEKSSKFIGRIKNGCLFYVCVFADDRISKELPFSHLFQFIKERRRVFNRRIIRR